MHFSAKLVRFHVVVNDVTDKILSFGQFAVRLIFFNLLLFLEHCHCNLSIADVILLHRLLFAKDEENIE